MTLVLKFLNTCGWRFGARSVTRISFQLPWGSWHHSKLQLPVHLTTKSHPWPFLSLPQGEHGRSQISALDQPRGWMLLLLWCSWALGLFFYPNDSGVPWWDLKSLWRESVSGFLGASLAHCPQGHRANSVSPTSRVSPRPHRKTFRLTSGQALHMQKLPG